MEINNLDIPLTALKELRRDLHRNPELSEREFRTAEKIVRFLNIYPPDELIEHLGGNGIAAIYKGKKPGPTVLIRCELDALPIQEINKFSHRSKIAGISHKCGHDGHMAIVAGVAALLYQHTPRKGRVILLFQPAEENGKGAEAILADEKFSRINPDYVFALHNLPGFPLGQVVVKNGSFTPAVNSIIIKLKGKTAHAGEPHQGINPAIAIAEIIQALNGFVVSDVYSEKFCVVTPIHINMGEVAYGISAGEGEVHFTIRCRTNERMRSVEQQTEKSVKEIAKKHRLKVSTEWTQSFFANQNNPKAVDWIRLAAVDAGCMVKEADIPFSWGEDFGLFTEKFPGAMFGLGAGETTPALHNPDYDFPDDLIGKGAQLFYQLIQTVQHV